MNRPQAYYRHQRKRWIKRRKKIIECVWDSQPWKPDNYFSKNKVHCSCSMCAKKTNKSEYGYNTYGRWKKNWKHSDKKKLLHDRY